MKRRRRHTDPRADGLLTWLHRYQVVFTTVGAVTLSIAALAVSVASYFVSVSEQQNTAAQTRIASLQYQIASAEHSPRFEVTVSEDAPESETLGDFRVSNHGNYVVVHRIDSQAFLLFTHTEETSLDATPQPVALIPVNDYLEDFERDPKSGGSDYIGKRQRPTVPIMHLLTQKMEAAPPAEFNDIEPIVVVSVEYTDMFGVIHTANSVTDFMGTLQMSSDEASQAYAEYDRMADREMILSTQEPVTPAKVFAWVNSVSREPAPKGQWIPAHDGPDFF